MGPAKLKLMERWNLLFGAAFTLVAAIFWPTDVALGVALGATLCNVNFYAIRRIWQALLDPGAAGKRQAMQTLFLLKSVLLIGLVFVVVRFLPIHPVGFAVGLSIFLLSVAIESARFALGGSAHPPPNKTG